MLPLVTGLNLRFPSFTGFFFNVHRLYSPPGLKAGVYKVYQVFRGRISSLERGREYHDCGEEYNVEKREMGSNIIIPIILRLLGRILSGEGGLTIWGKKIKM